MADGSQKTCEYCGETYTLGRRATAANPQRFCKIPCRDDFYRRERNESRMARHAAAQENTCEITMADGQQPTDKIPRIPSTSTVDYSDDDMAALKAVEAYKKRNRRQFPTVKEIIFVLRSIGWQKIHVS